MEKYKILKNNLRDNIFYVVGNDLENDLKNKLEKIKKVVDKLSYK